MLVLISGLGDQPIHKSGLGSHRPDDATGHFTRIVLNETLGFLHVILNKCEESSTVSNRSPAPAPAQSLISDTAPSPIIVTRPMARDVLEVMWIGDFRSPHHTLLLLFRFVCCSTRVQPAALPRQDDSDMDTNACSKWAFAPTVSPWDWTLDTGDWTLD